MVDKVIGELPGISSLDATSLFVAEQSGQAVKVSGKQLTDFSNVETTAQVEQAKASAQAAKTAQEAAEAAILKGPIIQNGTWWVYNQTAGAYQDTGIKATGPQGIPGPTSSVNGVSPDNSGNITLNAGNVNAYSKPESDALLQKKADASSVYTKTEADTILAKKADQDRVVNPNLLDNWYFGNPVNQRGQTSYTGAGYGIDRWIQDGSITTLLTNDGLQITNSSDVAFGISQMFETNYSGKTLTASILTDPGKVVVVWCNLNQIAVIQADSGGLATISFVAPTNDISKFSLSVGKGTFLFKAAKLELGSQQTLAHQENSVWVLNEIPDYGEQLARCQRYFYRWPYLVQYMTLSANGGYGMADFQFPVTMRTIPTITNIKGTNTDLSTFNFAAAQGGVHFQNTGTNMVSITNFDAVADL